MVVYTAISVKKRQCIQSYLPFDVKKKLFAAPIAFSGNWVQMALLALNVAYIRDMN